MVSELTRPEIQQYLLDHENDDHEKLLLARSEVLGVPASLIAAQLKGRRSAKHKLPLHYSTLGIIYPPTLNLEQASSQATAAFKAELARKQKTRNLAVDLTGGFGVDSYFFSRVFERLIYVERDATLCEIARHNFKVLGANNISVVNEDARSFLEKLSEPCDLLYIDPSRRSAAGRKVVGFASSDPDVVSLQETMLTRSPRLLVKASPMLDLAQAQRELKSTSAIYVIADHNECKEVLFECTREPVRSPLITAVELTSRENSLAFTSGEEKDAEAYPSPVLKYLYEPNAAIMKSGAFKIVAQRYAVKKLHAGTHLYTSDDLVTPFPGKTFLVIQRLRSDAKEVRQLLPEMKANVTTRNYPLTPDALRKKLALRDGGDRFVIGLTDANGKAVYLAERIDLKGNG